MHENWLSWPRIAASRDAAAWHDQASGCSGCRMGIPSLALKRRLACAECLASQAYGSSRWSGAQKKTACGGCGRVQTGWYDRARRQVRDLSSAEHRIMLDVEVRRVACSVCGTVKRE